MRTYKEHKYIPSNLTNYFLQGVVLFGVSYVLFWIQLTPYYWAWSSLLVFNVTISILLVLVIGIVNMMISESLWSVTLMSNIESWIAQGVLIVIPTQILLIFFQVAILFISENLTFALLIYGLVLFFVYSMIFGIIGISAARKYTQSVLEHDISPDHTSTLFRSTRARCPSCGESFRYFAHNISEEGTVTCLNCKHTFPIETTEALLRNLGKYRKDESNMDIQ